MELSVEDVAGAFEQRRHRPAVFDRAIREQVGQWRLTEEIPVSDIIDQFVDHAAFDQGDVVKLPVHEPASAELTGEFLVYRPATETVFYYEFSEGSLLGLDLVDLVSSYPAWQLRFWHPDYEPPDPPTYRTNGTDKGVEAVAMSAPEAGDSTAGTAPANGEAAASAEDHLETIRSMLAEEKLADREAARREWETLPTKEYIDKHGGVTPLSPAGVETDAYGERIVRFELPDADARTGDPDGLTDSEVLLDVRGECEGFPAEATVTECDAGELAVSVYWDRGPTNPPLSAFEPEEGHEFVAGVLLDPTPYDRRSDALAAIADDERRLGWLTGNGVAFADEPVATPSKTRLDASQYAGAERALSAADVCCLHGPPGTGTTRTLIEIIRAACSTGDRVLAVAPSPRAIDDLLAGNSTADATDPDSLHHVIESSELTATRVGGDATSDLVADAYVGNDRYQSDVVCSTLAGAEEFGVGRFDWVIVDEATRVSVAETLVPVSRGERVVLAGDPMQLPPSPASEYSESESITTSLFDHLQSQYGADVVTSLRTQYRMHEAIAAFPNEAFYAGKLTHGQRNRDWTIPGMAPLAAVAIDGEESQSPSGSYYNEAEVDAVSAEVSDLLAAGVAPANIGVMTPYSAQVGKLRVGIEELDATGTDRILVDTIEQFQGRTREATIISFVRSNPQGFSGNLTYPEEGPRRLNVALTRAQRRCTLVGNFDTLRTRAPTRDPEESSAATYRRLFEHLQETGVLSE